MLDGTPTLRDPDGERVLRRGDVVCFPTGPEGAHQVRGPGHGDDPLGEPRRSRSASTRTAARSASRTRRQDLPHRRRRRLLGRRMSGDRQPLRRAARKRTTTTRPATRCRTSRLGPLARRLGARDERLRARRGPEHLPVPLRVPRGGVAARPRGHADAPRIPRARTCSRPGDVVCFPTGPEGAHKIDEPTPPNASSSRCSRRRRRPRSPSTPTATRSASGRATAT